MAYTDVFGGQLLFPSQLSYLLITTAVDVQLSWPTEQQIGGDGVVADFLDIDATATNLNIDMPSATATGTGNKTTINNVGSNDFDVRDNDDVSIVTISPGEQWVLVLTDNTTNAGTWSSFQLGATVSQATASALAGAGIKSITTTLNQKIDSDVVNTTPFSIVDGDRARCTIYTAGAGTCNLANAATVGDDWFFMIRNSGTGTLNIVPPSGSIDGAASLNLDQNVSCFIFTDGTDYFTVGLSSPSVIGFDFVEIAVPGSGDFVLSGANLDRISYRFTGALTGNRRIVVPSSVQQYWVDNQTSGAFTLEIDTAAGSGQVITQGESAIVYCDATDVINAVSSTSVTFPITVGQGGTGATNATDARNNLSAAFSGRLINTLANSGLANGGDLTADRDLELDVNNLSSVAPDSADFLAFEDVSAANVTVKATIADIIGTVSGLPSGNQFDTIYISTAPDTYTASNAISVNPGTSVTINDDLIVVDTLIDLDNSGASTLARMQARNSAGGWRFDIIATTANARIVQTDSAGTLEDIWIQMTRNGNVALYNNNTQVAATAATGSGGFQADIGSGLEPVGLVEQGSFTADFSGDFSGTVQRTCEYVSIKTNGGRIVGIFLPSVSGTSTSTQFASGATDIPSAIRPSGSNTVSVLGYVVDNSGPREIGRLTITNGQFEFFLGNEVVFNSWTGSGTKSCDDVNFVYQV